MTGEISKAIDQVYADAQGSSFRAHLGASVLGHACARKVWYDFRWAHNVLHTGRILRLWERGHREEEQFIRCLRRIGFEVSDVDQDTGKQPVFSDHNGHFGGSRDALIWTEGNLFGLKGDGLSEFKTYGDKYFNQLKAKGVLTYSLSHFVQMQIYMHYFNLKWALYLAVNKNTDELYDEIILYAEEVALRYVDRAKAIIESQEAPPKIHDSESWWMCRMCDYRSVCHRGTTPDKNCRSCVFAQPVEDGKWRCNRFGSIIPEDFLPQGCGEWIPLRAS